MLYSQVTKLVILLVMLSGSHVTIRAGWRETTVDTRKLLAAMDDVRTDSEKLAVLFRTGDKRVKDLIRLLNDPDPKVRLRAQVVIRYLGNEDGMNALREWYRRQKGEYGIAGPTPIPLSEWDYNFIEVNLLTNPPQTWRERGVQYIYALALDGSPRANSALAELIKKAHGLDQSDFVGYAIRRVQSEPDRVLKGEDDLAKLVFDNAFFIAPGDQPFTSTRLLGFAGTKDKALVEVHIKRGTLAEEWYHVVLRKGEPGWRFFSISPVSIS